MDGSSARAVCILGMHRSGTSMVSRSLNLLGVNLGEENKLVAKGRHNQKGFWEYRKITRTQESLLKVFGHNWYTAKPLPKRWCNKLEIQPIRGQLKEIVEADFQDSMLWGWKDPRNSLTLPMWQQILPELNIDLSYVIAVRNPIDVAASLEVRNNFTFEHSLKLWGLYTISALIGTYGEKRVIVLYDDFLADWEDELKNISEKLTIPWPKNEEQLKQSMNEFVTKDLQHNKSTLRDLKNNQNIPKWVVKTYKLITQAKGSDEFLASGEFTKRLVYIYNSVF